MRGARADSLCYWKFLSDRAPPITMLILSLPARFSTDDELMMAALNELCSVFLLIFEDVPFFTMTTLLLYNTVEINQPTWQPLNDTSAVGDLVCGAVPLFAKADIV